MSDTQFYSFYQHQFGNDKPIAFDHLDHSLFTQAMHWAIAKAKSELEVIVRNPLAPTFENTIVALEQMGAEVSTISSVFFNLYHANTSKVLQDQVADISLCLSRYGNEVLLNEAVFLRIQTVHAEELKHNKLNDVDKRLLSETYISYVNNGALLSSDDKNKLKAISEQLAQLGPKFSQHILDNTNAYSYHTEDKNELEGVPEHVQATAALQAKRAGKTGWQLSLQAPCYLPVMQYATNRALRERLYRARAGLAFNDSYDNTSLIKEIVALRQQKAQLLGCSHYAEYILRKRMAKNVTTVETFLDELESKYRVSALTEFSELESWAAQEGVAQLQAWDVAYYSMRYQQKQLDFDEELLRPYFRHDRVLDGVFELANKLYGLSFRPNEQAPTYHQDVACYTIEDKDACYVGLLYVDLYPREGKNQGAWMTTWKTQHIHQGVDQRPMISIVMNATPKNDQGYAFMSFDEVETLFHEFGHALHAACSQVPYASLASPNVYWDFVELPSQIMENFLKERKVLDLFAQHDETGETISDLYLDKIHQRELFQVGMQGLRQISLARLDLAWHTQEQAVHAVDDFEEQVMQMYRLVAKVANTNMSCQFSHIFAGGYAAGYYSYKWAEVLDADAFKMFKQQGVFNQEVAKRFRETILALGNSVAPDTLYQRFRQAKPTTKALFERSGL